MASQAPQNSPKPQDAEPTSHPVMAASIPLSPPRVEEIIKSARSRAALPADRYEHLTAVAAILTDIGAQGVERRDLFDQLVNLINAECRLIRLERAFTTLTAWTAVPGRSYNVRITKSYTPHRFGPWRVCVRLLVNGRKKNFTRCGGSEVSALELALTLAATYANGWAESVERGTAALEESRGRTDRRRGRVSSHAEVAARAAAEGVTLPVPSAPIPIPQPRSREQLAAARRPAPASRSDRRKWRERGGVTVCQRMTLSTGPELQKMVTQTDNRNQFLILALPMPDENECPKVQKNRAGNAAEETAD